VRLCRSKREATSLLVVIWVDGGSLSSGRLNTGLSSTREADRRLSRKLRRVDSGSGRWEDVGGLRSSNGGCSKGSGGRSSSDLGSKGQDSAVESLRELHLDVVGLDGFHTMNCVEDGQKTCKVRQSI